MSPSFRLFPPKIPLIRFKGLLLDLAAASILADSSAAFKVLLSLLPLRDPCRDPWLDLDRLPWREFDLDPGLLVLSSSSSSKPPLSFLKNSTLRR